MIADFMTLDTRLAPRLVRPFYLAGAALALLLAGIGLLLGAAALTTSVPLALLFMVLGGLVGGVTLTGVRLVAEATLAVLALQDRASAQPMVSRTV